MNAKTLLVILAAAGTGIAVGMLMAPKKAADLQDSVKDSADGRGNELGDLIAKGKEKLMSEKKRLASHTSVLKNDIKHTADHIQPTHF